MLKESTGLEAQYEEYNQAKKLADQHYQELEQKQQLTEANSVLIQRKAGEVLEVLDPATLPVQPTKPDRHEVSWAAALRFLADSGPGSCRSAGSEGYVA